MIADAPCQPKWINTTKDEFNQQKQATFTAAVQQPLNYLTICRPLTHDHVGYFDSQRGCVYTYSNIVVITTFEVLTGTGFSWGLHNQLAPINGSSIPNAFLVGTDGNGNIYLGRCNNHNSSYIGKITKNKFQYNYKEVEVTECDQHDILLC